MHGELHPELRDWLAEHGWVVWCIWDPEMPCSADPDRCCVRMAREHSGLTCCQSEHDPF